MPIDPPALGPLLGNPVNTIISPFYTLFSTNATYCFTARTNVQTHRTETETLEGNLLRVEQRITDGERNGLIPTDEAESWVQRANRAISEETANRESFDKRCRIFGCSLSCWGNYKTSKQAAEKVDAVRKCISSTPATDNITRVPPPPPVIDFSTHSIQLLPSREDTLQHALTCIKDDLTVGVIGIWGPDRDEKTHLLKKINNSFLGGCPFDFVIFLTASSECSVQNIQAQITKRLRINQLDDVATQATRISELLRTKTFLLLVDDLRVQLDLQAVGIPYPLGDVEVVAVAQDSEIVEAVQDGGVSCKLKRKVVITSISQPICLLMDADRYIPVPDLGEGEARQLFAKEFGAPLDSNAEALVRELKGLPSDLIRYGKLMQGIIDVRQWEVAIDAVRKANLQRNDPLNLAEKIVRNVENAIKDLDAKGNDVRREIADAELQCKTPTNEVKRWLEKVEKLCEAVRVISADCRLLKKDVTMLASEMLCDVQECLSTCPSIVAVESMPPPVQEMPGPLISVGNHNLQDALMYINDEPTVGMIGIWGPGGVGKTHLLKNINNSFGEGMAFNYVLFVTASRGCSVEKLQSQIIERLGLQSTGSKWRTIYEYMKTKSFLVLLDDLWEQINLEDVGIPYPLGTLKNLKRKVVLTTRLRQVCGQMGVKREFTVACLHEDEAWHLFAENVGVETLSSPNIVSLAKELAKELKGLPLALTVVGKAMYQKDKSQWEIAIQYMQQSCCTDDKDPVELGMETSVFRKLKFSYDNLRNDTLRECFKTCALWPEDDEIDKHKVAQCWMGLGLVNERDIESSYRKSYSLIADLRAACLLEGPEGWIDVVKVHDVIRDMALWISCDCGENNDKWIVPAPIGKDKKFSIPWNRAAKTVECISLDETRRINLLGPAGSRLSQLVPIGFNPVNLRILRLRRSILDESGIGNAIKNCTSLTYLDLSWNRLKRIPEELCSLEKLEFLDLSYNSLEEMPQCLGRLIYLKFLYLRWSGIQTIPIGVMFSLKSLQEIDLRTGSRYTEEGTASFIPGVSRDLDTLPHLKAVGIEVGGNAQFESLREASNLPIRYLTLSRLDKSALSLSDIFSNNFVQSTLYDLKIRYCHTLEDIIFRHDPTQPSNHFDALDKLLITGMEQLKDVMWIGATPASMFPSLTCLNLWDCHRLLHVSWVMYLPSLELLRVSDCPLMVQAFMRCHADKLCNSQENKKTFPSLKTLFLLSLEQLETIGDNGMEFPSLERLKLNECPKLKRLPFKSDSLPLKLKEVRVNHVQDWERLECEEGVKTFLQPSLKFFG